MDDYLSNKPKNFVDDLEKLYKQRRREAQAKKLEIADPKAEAEGSLESPKKSLPPSPKKDKLKLSPMGEPQPERKSENYAPWTSSIYRSSPSRTSWDHSRSRPQSSACAKLTVHR
jgi:hypothetical protein